MSTAFVIPSYGKEEYTDAIVEQLLRDGVAGRDVIVVDNAGTYRAEPLITTITPARNLGWLIATNLGMVHAFTDPACEAVVWLNNDVEISPGFARALSAPLGGGAWMVGPVYDGINAAQHPADGADLASFVPSAAVRPVTWLEGTCALVSRTCFERVGLLDARNFGWRGWGADIDFALRAGSLGGEVVVTEAAFLHHEGQVTASAIDPAYNTGARREMTLAMRRRWGKGWADRYEVSQRQQPTSLLGRLRVRAEEYGGIPQRRRDVRLRLVEADRTAASLDRRSSEADEG